MAFLGETGNNLIVGQNNSDSVFSGQIIDAFSGSGVLTKIGTGTLTLSGNTSDYSEGTTIDGGTLLANNTSGSATGTGPVQVNSGGTLGGTGSVDGTITVKAGGTLAPGASAGTLSTGVVTFNSGTLEIELFAGGGSPVAGVDFDQLTANTATLGGTLDLVVDPNYTPALADTFQIISTTSGVTGTFSNVNGAYLGGGLGFDVQYNANNVTIEAINVLLGDFDVDGDVDGFDFLKWQRDPTVGPLVDWEANYGMVGPLSAATAAVPEPGPLALFGLGAILFSLRQRGLIPGAA